MNKCCKHCGTDEDLYSFYWKTGKKVVCNICNRCRGYKITEGNKKSYSEGRRRVHPNSIKGFKKNQFKKGESPWNKDLKDCYTGDAKYKMGSSFRFKTYESVMGEEKAAKRKEKLSKDHKKLNKGNKANNPHEKGLKISTANRGVIDPRKNKTYAEYYGKVKAEEIKQKIREKITNYRMKTWGKPDKWGIKGKNEELILNNLEKNLNYKILRSYPTKGYILDGYCPALKLAIEIDEDHHFNNDGSYKEKDIERQRFIENELNCSFLRIKDCQKKYYSEV